jgi:hypothetical protein
MIKKCDLNEAAKIASGVINNLLAAPGSSAAGLAGSQLRWDGGQLLAGIASQLLPSADGTQGTFWGNLWTIFEDARAAGADYASIDSVRVAVEALSTPYGLLGLAVQNIAIRYALAELAQILAAQAFVSRDDIDSALIGINAAFETAEETAADSFDSAAYQALISLHAAVAEDLSNREQTLPRLINISFATPLPALFIAQMIYQDGTRAAEIVAENKAPHPLFMPMSIRALSL